ncbi:MAG: hypothetical protein ACRDRV_01095 [Pseudonocardiaceae bacterium]
MAQDTGTGRLQSVRRSRVPGVEARAGKFPGPSLIPELNASQSRLGWLAGSSRRNAELAERYGPQTEFREVPCLGRWDLAPAVAVNEHPAPAAETDALVAAARDGSLPAAQPTPSGRAAPWPNDPVLSVLSRFPACPPPVPGMYGTGAQQPEQRG